MILVISDDRRAAGRLKSMIEFMDSPHVVTAGPADWKATIADQRLDAVFIGGTIDDHEVSTLFDELEHIDPNVSIVMVEAAVGS